ncbi:MAG: hypothetical protein JSU87_17555 [Gemmatimonadota bacterium]|nr:MAG: hypothetical protein JSU87_17555 [Gemmatimonadota bacterium]
MESARIAVILGPIRFVVREYWRPASCVLFLSVGLAACESPRGRPFGLEVAAETFVAVRSPEPDALIAADSSARVVVEARGAVKAVEYVVVRATLPDTLALGRRQFEAIMDSVVVVFAARIPQLETGIGLEIRGVAEDALGVRVLSEPIYAIAIECDRFPYACGGP